MAPLTYRINSGCWVWHLWFSITDAPVYLPNFILTPTAKTSPTPFLLAESEYSTVPQMKSPIKYSWFLSYNILWIQQIKSTAWKITGCQPFLLLGSLWMSPIFLVQRIGKCVELPHLWCELLPASLPSPCFRCCIHCLSRL